MIKEKLLLTGLFEDNSHLDDMIKIMLSPEKSDFYEIHHILPKCCGGTDEEENLIALSLKQHFMVHYHLTFCTIGQPKKKLCFAFKQMIFTRDSFKTFPLELIEKLSEQYETLLKDGYFKNNYIRTDEIKDKISKGVGVYNKRCKWINNGIEEKFVNETDCKLLLEKGYKLGRLKQEKISKSLTGKKRVPLEKRLEEFKKAIETKDRGKRFHVHYEDKEAFLNGYNIANSEIPWEYGRKHLSEKQRIEFYKKLSKKAAEKRKLKNQ